MAIRITIMLDEDLHIKLRELQGKMIKNHKIAISFSQVLNNTLRKSLKAKS